MEQCEKLRDEIREKRVNFDLDDVIAKAKADKGAGNSSLNAREYDKFMNWCLVVMARTMTITKYIALAMKDQVTADNIDDCLNDDETTLKDLKIYRGKIRKGRGVDII